jgi:hypothetical protein
MDHTMECLLAGQEGFKATISADQEEMSIELETHNKSGHEKLRALKKCCPRKDGGRSMGQLEGDDSYHKGHPREYGGQDKCHPLHPRKIEGNSK